jgi:hypothetical protein
MKKTNLFRYVRISLGALTVAFIMTLTTPEVTLVFTTNTWLWFFISFSIMLFSFLVNSVLGQKEDSVRTQVIIMTLLILSGGALTYCYLTLPKFMALLAGVWVTLLVGYNINQSFQKCDLKELGAELKNEVESRVNYPPVAIDDEAQSGINSDSEKDVKN